jgi:hypothetical protein
MKMNQQKDPIKKLEELYNGIKENPTTTVPTEQGPDKTEEKFTQLPEDVA